MKKRTETFYYEGEDIIIKSIDTFQIIFKGDSWWYRLGQFFRFIFTGEAVFHIK